MAASASQVVPSEYFDSVFDRSRPLDQFEVFYREASKRAESIYRTPLFEYELHDRSAIYFNRQVEIRVGASGPARATTKNIERDYFGSFSRPFAENIAQKLLHGLAVVASRPRRAPDITGSDHPLCSKRGAVPQ